MSRRIIGVLLGVLLVGGLVYGYVSTTQPVMGSESCEPRPVDTTRLEAHVRMLSETLRPRDAAHPENLDRAAAYVRTELERAGLKVEEQPFRVGEKEYRNLIARVGPESPSRVVVGAHYDAWSDLPGADDNASGVAGLLELARSLGERAPAVQVELVAYSLEEPPHFRLATMGSAIHARSLTGSNAGVTAMLSLEMIGFFTDAPHSQEYPLSLLKWLYPTTGNFITVVGRRGHGATVRTVKRAMQSATPLPVAAITAPSFVHGVDFSDHLNYWERGDPAVMITDTAFLRNPHYHEPTDTADRLDYVRMSQVVQGVDCAVRALARDAAQAH